MQTDPTVDVPVREPDPWANVRAPKKEPLTFDQLMAPHTPAVRQIVAQGRNARARLQEIGRLELVESRKVANCIVRLRARDISQRMIAKMLGMSSARVSEILRRELGRTKVR